MKATEIKNWKTLSTFVYDLISGKDDSYYKDEDFLELNEVADGVLNELGDADLYSSVNKIMNLNILDKNVRFDLFEKLPAVWNRYFPVADKVVIISKNN